MFTLFIWIIYFKFTCIFFKSFNSIIINCFFN